MDHVNEDLADVPAAVEMIDDAIEAIAEYHRVREVAFERRLVVNSESEAYDRSVEIEHDRVIPGLERARQIAEKCDCGDLGVASDPNKAGQTREPYSDNLKALVGLRTRVAEQERMDAVLGPAGPQLATEALHPKIWAEAADMFDDGHYRSAVQAAGSALESHLQTKAGGDDLYGEKLGELFGKGDKGARLYFPAVTETRTERDARAGGNFLIRGAFQGIRNLVSHGGWPYGDEPNEALEMLAVLSYVARLVDRAEMRE